MPICDCHDRAPFAALCLTNSSALLYPGEGGVDGSFA